jgi:DNA repair protein RecO (recombination protein O)
MYINTKALVLRSVAYQDSGRILTVLTPDMGKLTVSSRGAMRKNSRVAPSVQALAFSEVTLFRARDRWTLTEAQTIELFPGLADDLARLALGTYFAELLEAVADADSPSPELLSLGLNALYALSGGARPAWLVKAAFETRLMCLTGYAPRLDACAVCGAPELAGGCLQLAGGTALCRACAAPGEGLARLDGGSLRALRHVSSCEPKKIFAFTLEAGAAKRLRAASEQYVLAQLDRRFKTLDYYHSIKEHGHDAI